MLRSSAKGLVSLLAQHQAALSALGQASSNVSQASSGWRSYISDPKITVRKSTPEHEPSTEDIMFCDENTGATIAAHPGLKMDAQAHLLQHPVYSKEYAEGVTAQHKPIESFSARVGHLSMCATMGALNMFTGYRAGARMSDEKWLNHLVFMESVLGCPGMVGAMMRHMASLRSLKRDHGWIHTLLEESENSRMHLLMFMQMSQPTMAQRLAILFTQGFVFNVYLVSYLICPAFCHHYVGYMAEEATKTYTHLLKEIDAGHNMVGQKAPEMAISYWKLDPATATIRDVVLSARADEACHSYVNHTFAGLSPSDRNPFTAAGRNMQP